MKDWWRFACMWNEKKPTSGYILNTDEMSADVDFERDNNNNNNGILI